MEKRNEKRVPLSMWINKLFGDDIFLCRTADLSEGGVYLSKLIEPEWRGREVSLEFQLPGDDEVIWAAGEIVRDTRRGREEGSGIRFTRIPERYKERVRQFLLCHEYLAAT